MTLFEAAVEVLGKIVGPIPAKMCIHSACVELGKTAETVGRADFDALATKIRGDMSRFASPDLIESALAEVQSML